MSYTRDPFDTDYGPADLDEHDELHDLGPLHAAWMRGDE